LAERSKSKGQMVHFRDLKKGVRGPRLGGLVAKQASKQAYSHAKRRFRIRKGCQTVHYTIIKGS
jgi:hypothetical protein